MERGRWITKSPQQPYVSLLAIHLDRAQVEVECRQDALAQLRIPVDPVELQCESQALPSSTDVPNAVAVLAARFVQRLLCDRESGLACCLVVCVEGILEPDLAGSAVGFLFILAQTDGRKHEGEQCGGVANERELEPKRHVLAFETLARPVRGLPIPQQRFAGAPQKR